MQDIDPISKAERLKQALEERRPGWAWSVHYVAENEAFALGRSGEWLRVELRLDYTPEVRSMWVPWATAVNEPNHLLADDIIARVETQQLV